MWKSAYYRLAMYLYDLVWLDSVLLNKDFRGSRHILGEETLEKRIKVVQQTIALTVTAVDRNRKTLRS